MKFISALQEEMYVTFLMNIKISTIRIKMATVFLETYLKYLNVMIVISQF